jgi:hypothetical protein
MHVRVVVLVKIPNCLDYSTRLLRSRSVIEINQRMSVRLLAKNREIFAKSLPIDVAAYNLVHTTISSTRRDTPLYSDNGQGDRQLRLSAHGCTCVR